MSQQWFLVQAGKEDGPFSSRQLKSLATSGRLTPQMLVRRDDQAKSLPAGRLKGLFVEGAAITASLQMPAALSSPEQQPIPSTPNLASHLPADLSRAEAGASRSSPESPSLDTDVSLVRSEQIAARRLRISEIRKSVTQKFLTGAPDLPGCSSVKAICDEINKHRIDIANFDTRLDQLESARVRIERLERDSAQAQKDFETAHGRLVEFHKPLGTLVFWEFLIGNLAEHSALEARSQLEQRINALVNDRDELASQPDAGLIQNAKVKSRQLAISAQLMLEKSRINEADRRIGQCLIDAQLEVSFRRERTERLIGEIQQLRKEIQQAAVKRDEAKENLIQQRLTTAAELDVDEFHDGSQLKDRVREIRKQRSLAQHLFDLHISDIPDRLKADDELLPGPLANEVSELRRLESIAGRAQRSVLSNTMLKVASFVKASPLLHPVEKAACADPMTHTEDHIDIPKAEGRNLSTVPHFSHSLMMRILAVCMLLYAMPFGVLYLLGFLENVGRYEPIVPVICPLTAYFCGAIAMLGQMVAAMLLWFRSPKAVSVSGCSAFCLVLLVGVAIIGALPFNDWFPAILVGLSSVWPTIFYFVVKRLFHISQLRVPGTCSVLESTAYLIAGVCAAVVGMILVAVGVAEYPGLIPRILAFLARSAGDIFLFVIGCSIVLTGIRRVKTNKPTLSSKSPAWGYVNKLGGSLLLLIGVVLVAMSIWTLVTVSLTGPKTSSQTTQFSAPTSYQQATSLHETGNLTEAIEAYNQSISQLPAHVPSYFGRGRALAECKQFDRAIADYDEALRLDGQLAAAYNERGLAHLNLGQWQTAMEDFDHSVRLGTEQGALTAILAVYVFNRGYSHHQLSDMTQAEVDYDNAIELDPTCSDACYWRGVLNQQQGDLQNSLRDLDAAIKLVPNHYGALNLRAFIKSTSDDDRIRDGHRALLDALTACEITEWKDSNIVATLAAAHAAVGDYGKAKETAALAIRSASAQDAALIRSFLAPLESNQPVRVK